MQSGGNESEGGSFPGSSSGKTREVKQSLGKGDCCSFPCRTGLLPSLTPWWAGPASVGTPALLQPHTGAPQAIPVLLGTPMAQQGTSVLAQQATTSFGTSALMRSRDATTIITSHCASGFLRKEKHLFHLYKKVISSQTSSFKSKCNLFLKSVFAFLINFYIPLTSFYIAPTLFLNLFITQFFPLFSVIAFFTYLFIHLGLLSPAFLPILELQLHDTWHQWAAINSSFNALFPFYVLSLCCFSPFNFTQLCKYPFSISLKLHLPSSLYD